MKKIIRKRWIVEGYYRYCGQTNSWEFLSEFRPGKVAWEFDEYTLIYSVDGKIEHTVPYALLRDNILVIDFSSMIPHFNKYLEIYKAMRRGSEVWLYDRKTKTPGCFWLMLKLVPTE